MAKLIEIDEFTEEVYQLEVTDFVEGGENGVDNKPHKALANRTRWLKSRIDAFLAGTGLTKAMVGLSNVDNTADLAKPISTATQNVLDSFVGQVAFFAMETAPIGWLKANGATISRTTYSNLFNVIGTTFGVGDGSTTFEIPDLRGEFIRGYDDSRGIDASRVLGSLQGDAIRNITGKADFGDNQNNTGALVHNTIGVFSKTNENGVWYQDYNPNQYSQNNGQTLVIDASLQVPTANENRPRNIAMLACIKY